MTQTNVLLKTAAGIFVVSFVCAYLVMKRRPYLGWRMNLLGALLLDPQPLFPERLPPRAQSDKRLVMVRKFRQLWENIARLLGKVLTKKQMDKIEDFSVPSRESGRVVPVRLYLPTLSSSSRNHEVTLPVVMTIHGGGWTYGSIAVYDAMNRLIADKAQAVVCAVDYRLSPENPFPAGLEDCEDVLRWIWSDPVKLTQDFIAGPRIAGLAIGGDSAGGNLTAVLAVFAKNNGIVLDMQCLLYPATCAFALPLWRPAPHIRLSGDSTLANAHAPVLTLRGLLECWDSYLDIQDLPLAAEDTSPNVLHDPRVSPMMFTLEDVRGTAPCHLATASADVLLDEGRAYANKLKDAGVDVTYVHYEDTIHAFMSLAQCNHHERGMEDLCASLRKAFREKETAANNDRRG